MKLGQKLIIGFIWITVLVCFFAFITSHLSQTAMEQSIGKCSVVISSEILHEIDRAVYNRIEQIESMCSQSQFRRFVNQSNRHYAGKSAPDDFIHEQDTKWMSLPKDTVSTFMNELMNNELAETLNHHLSFYKHKNGYNVFSEMFVTNRYGVNVAMTNKTSDFYQADEHWWQQAKVKGVYVSDIQYDRSADVYCLDVAVRMEDEQDQFLGVTKVILNIEEIENIINNVASVSHYRKSVITLYNKDMRVIYSTGPHPVLKSHGDSSLHRQFIKRAQQYFVADDANSVKKLYAHAHSCGYRNFRGLGWILIIEHDADEVFRPVANLKRTMAAVSFAVVLLVLLVAVLVTGSVNKPLAYLKNVIGQVSAEDGGINSQCRDIDEINQAAVCLHNISTSLEKTREDIEKEKLTREYMKKQLDRMKDRTGQYLDAAGDMIVCINNDFSVRFINKKGCDVLGLYREQIIGRNWIEHFVPDPYKLSVEKLLSDYFEACDLDNEEIEVAVINSDGRHRVVRWHHAGIINEDGKNEAVLLSGKDVTDEQQTEEKIKMLEAISRENPYPILKVSAGCIVLYANDAAKPVLDAWQTSVGRPLPQRWCKTVLKSITEELKITNELQCGERLLSLSFTPISNENYINIYGLDITDQKQLLDAKKIHVGNLHSVIKAVSVPMLLVDDQMTVCEVNNAAAKLVNKNAARVIEKSFGQAFSCEHYFEEPLGCGNSWLCSSCPIRNAVKNVIHSFRPVHAIEIAPTFIIDGKEKNLWLEMSFEPVDVNGKKYVIMAINELTDEKRTQDTLVGLNRDLQRTIAKLENANKQLNDFARLTANDLKTPLRGISTLAKWFAKDYENKLDEQAKRNLKLMMNRAGKIDTRIDAVMEYLHIDQNRGKKRPIESRSVIEDVISQFDRSENIEINIKEKMPTLYCEESHVFKIFYNLIENAVQYNDKARCKIWISCETDSQGFWKFSITDNGPGIEKNRVPEVFEPFTSFHSDDQHIGCGIGLSIVKKIVEIYDGKVWFDTHQKDITTVCFTMPQLVDEEVRA